MGEADSLVLDPQGLHCRRVEERHADDEARGAERGGSALGEEVEDRLDGHHSIAAEGGARPSLARTARGGAREAGQRGPPTPGYGAAQRGPPDALERISRVEFGLHQLAGEVRSR